jgi:hypothetical protein
VTIKTFYELFQRNVTVFVGLTETAFVRSGIPMSIRALLSKYLDQSGAKRDLDPFDRIEQKDTQALVEKVEVDHLIEMGSSAKFVTSNNLIVTAVNGAETPERITEGAQAIVSDAPQRTQGMLAIRDHEPPKNHYIEALLGRPEGLEINQHFEDGVLNEEDRAVAGRRGQARGHRS